MGAAKSVNKEKITRSFFFPVFMQRKANNNNHGNKPYWVVNISNGMEKC